MPSPAGQNKPPHGKRVRRVLRTAVAALCCAVVLLYLLRNVVLAPVLIRTLSGFAREKVGVDLEIGSVSGSWFRDIAFHEVRLRSLESANALQRAGIRTLGFEYSPVRFLRGRRGALRTVGSSDATVALDFSTPSPGSGQAGAGLSLPPSLPRIEVSNLSVEVLLPGDRRARIKGIDVSARPAGDGSDLRIGVDALSIDSAPETSGTPIPVSIAGTYAEGILDLREVSLGEGAVSGSGVLRWSSPVADDLRCRLDLHWAGGGVFFEGARSGDRFRLDLSASGLETAPILSFLAPQFTGVAAGVIDGKASVAGPIRRSEEIRGTVDFRVRNGCIAGFGPLRIGGRLSLANGILSAAPVLVDHDAAHLEIRRFDLPIRAADPWEILRTARGEAWLQAENLGGLAGSLLPDRVADRLPLSAGFLDIVLADGRLLVRDAAIESPAGAVRVVSGVLRAPRAGEGSGLRLDDVVAVVSDVDPAEWIRAFGRDPAAATGRVDAEITASGPLGRPEVKGFVTASNIQFRDLAPAEAYAELSWTPGRALEVAHVRVDSPYGSANGSGGIDPGARWIERLAFECEATDASRLPFLGLDGGRAMLTAELHGPLLDPDGRIEFRASSLVRGDLVVDSVRLRLAKESSRYLVDDFTVATSAGGISSSGSVDVARDRARAEVRLDRLELSGAHGSLALEEPATVVVGRNVLRTGPVRLTGDAGEILLRIDFQRGRGGLDLEARRLEVMAFADPFLPPGMQCTPVDLQFRLSRDAGGPEANLATRFDFRFEEEPPYSLDCRARWAGGRLRLDRFTVRSDPGFAVDLRGSVPLVVDDGKARIADGDLELRGTLQASDPRRFSAYLPAGLDLLGGSANAEVEIAGEAANPRGRATLEVDDAVLRIGPIAEETRLGPIDFSAALVLGDGIELTRAALDLPGSLTASLRGRILDGAGLRALVSGEGGERATGLDLRWDFAARDPGFLSRWVSSVQRFGGRLSGEGSLTGTLKVPEASGRVEWTEGEIRFAESPVAVRSLNARIDFAGRALEIVRCEGRLGGAPFSVRGRIEGPIASPRIELDLAGTGLLLARSDDLRIRADADLTLEGEGSSLRLAGSVGLRDCVYSRDLELTAFLQRGGTPRSGRGFRLFSLREAPWSEMTFDVGIRAVEPFRIDSNVARLALRPDLHLGGTGNRPILTGLVAIDPGSVYLPAAALDIEGGTISFSPENPFVPEIDIRGSTRMYSYDVEARAVGPYDFPEILLTSSPPLPREELLAMLLMGRPPQDSGSAKSSDRIAAGLLLYFGGHRIPRWLGLDAEKDARGLLERFEVELGREATESGAESVEFRFRLHPEDPFGGRRFLYLVGEQDVYDRINMGLRWVRRMR